MGNYITSRSFLTPTGTIKSTEDSSFPASNVDDYWLPYRPWRCNDALGTGNYVGLDFGSGQTLAAVVVDGVNVPTFVIEADAAATFDSSAGSPDYSSGNLSPALDLYSRGAASWYKAIVFPAVSKRYLRVRYISGTATDGGKMTVGSIAAFSAITTWTYNTGFPFTKELRWEVVAHDQHVSGGRAPARAGNPYAVVTLPTNQEWLATMRTTMETVLAYGQHRPFLFWENDTEIGNPYLVRRVGDISISKTGVDLIRLGGSLLLEEVVTG